MYVYIYNYVYIYIHILVGDLWSFVVPKYQRCILSHVHGEHDNDSIDFGGFWAFPSNVQTNRCEKTSRNSMNIMKSWSLPTRKNGFQPWWPTTPINSPGVKGLSEPIRPSCVSKWTHSWSLKVCNRTDVCSRTQWRVYRSPVASPMIPRGAEGRKATLISSIDFPRSFFFHWEPSTNIWLVVSTPLKNMKVSWDDYSQYMEQ